MALALAVLLVGSACSSAATDSSTAAEAGVDQDAATTPEQAAATDSADDDATADAAATETDSATASPGSNLSELVSELPPAPVGFPVADDGPQPTRLTIESLGIDQAPVIGVGVETDGAMEVPPADEVGWYRYSPLPGQAGSSILAAHIAFDGENGVFVRLADIELGAVVEVTDEEGLTRAYQVETVDRYDKEQLPEDIVFARSGTERLVLVTCGGRFDPELRSYDDNVVVVATPLDSAS
ncbi:MAG: class F sortase [Actinomycetota bacterium]